VAAKGPSLFSVCFENGRAGDHGSNTLVFVADPKFPSPPGSLPLQQRQVPTTLPPSLITVPAAAQAAARAPPPLKETIPEEVLAGTVPTVAPDPELAGMPPLIPLVPLIPQDDDATSSVASMLPVLGANWENLNTNDDKEEGGHENDMVEEVGEDVCQACEAEKKKLIQDGLAWTVGQITWAAVTDSAPTDPIPKHLMCGIRSFNFEAFQTLKKELKAKHQPRQSYKQKHQCHKHQNSRPCLKKFLLHFWPGDWRQHWRKLKAAFERENAARVKSAGKRAKKLRPPSQNEFWRFIGLIMAGGVNGQGGSCLWESRDKQLDCDMHELSKPPDVGRHVSLTRFEEIRKFFPKAFSDASRSDPAEDDCDPWHPIIALIEDLNISRHLNINRHQTVCSLNIKTVD
jgi:hypothetical protein